MPCGVALMIIYHPAYDVHHCTYRLLNLLRALECKEVSRDVLRMMDFYYVYPALLKLVKLPRPLLKYSSCIKSVADTFEIVPRPSALFYELCRLQDSALRSLDQRSLISLRLNGVKLNLSRVPQRLIEEFESDEFSSSTVFEALTTAFPKLRMDGKDGFKERSGLMEFRYA
ncbi:ABC-three component system middle component 5 [Pseudomonas aeruginosa]|uniref:ABC-three component system middle component 5 n=1 Tax=Pseudomonas aeruginosa TaxID=287 RepID=UPI003D769570